jgi:hypothetical protein
MGEIKKDCYHMLVVLILVADAGGFGSETSKNSGKILASRNDYRLGGEEQDLASRTRHTAFLYSILIERSRTLAAPQRDQRKSKQVVKSSRRRVVSSFTKKKRREDAAKPVPIIINRQRTTGEGPGVREGTFAGIYFARPINNAR